MLVSFFTFSYLPIWFLFCQLSITNCNYHRFSGLINGYTIKCEILLRHAKFNRLSIYEEFPKPSFKVT